MHWIVAQMRGRRKGVREDTESEIRNPKFEFRISACLSSFVRGADHDEAAVWPRYGTAHQDDVVVCIDADDAKVAHRDSAGTIPPGHAFASFRPAATTVAGDRADTARSPVMTLDTMTGR